MRKQIKQIPSKKITRKHAVKLEQAFYTKFDEYSKMTLEELKTLYNHSDKKLRPGGIYRRALIAVTENKLREERQAKLNEVTGENIPEVQTVEVETTTQETKTTEENGSSI